VAKITFHRNDLATQGALLFCPSNGVERARANVRSFGFAAKPNAELGAKVNTKGNLQLQSDLWNRLYFCSEHLMSRVSLLLSVVLALLIPSFLVAAQSDSWVGKNVVLKKLGTKLRNIDIKGDWVVAHTIVIPIATVIAEDNHKLKVVDAGISGWIDKEDALLPDDAVTHFTERLDKKPNDYTGHCLRACALLLKNKTDMALEEYTEAVGLKPNSPDAYAMRSMVYLLRIQFDKATADITKAIDLAPNESTYWYMRARIWDLRKEFSKARNDLDQALALNPRHSDAYNARGRMYALNEENAKALADFNEAVRLEPDFVNALIHRGALFIVIKEYAKAVRDFDEALRLAPDLRYLYARRGFAHAKTKNYSKAVADLTEAVRFDPKDVLSLATLARILAVCSKSGIREGKMAVEYATKACQLTNWSVPGFLDTLAAAHAENGQFELAVKWQKRALEFPEFEQHKQGALERLELYTMKMPCREE
jgi:tetratricopeptide (TPR) repeat protein